MNDSTDDFERRKCRALRRLGSDNPKCFACDVDDWRCLEAHHIAGKDYDGFTIVVCRNHHRLLSDAALDHPPASDGGDPFLTRIAKFLLGLADALGIVVEQLKAFARDLLTKASPAVSAAEA